MPLQNAIVLNDHFLNYMEKPTLVTNTLRSGGDQRQSEIFYVLKGEYFLKWAMMNFIFPQVTLIFLPQKLPHAWTQVSAVGKMEVIFQPAGKIDHFFLTVAALDHEPTKQEMAKIFEDNEMEVVGEPLGIK